ncbi:hypothetical protein QI260_07085 [Staphylococcus saprophyticus]|nr:hypothetical protein [Staphylococcus saprophyticus]
MKLFKKNIIWITTFTLLTLVSNFLFYRVANIYLKNDESYGIWLVILSIITWFYIMDFGISNSLRNYLTKAVEQNNKKEASKLIFTTYLIMLVPMIALIIGGVILNSFLDWSLILNVTENKEETNLLIKIAFILFPIIFYLNTISYVYHAYFKSYIVNVLQFLNLFINCIVIYICSFNENTSIVVMGSIYFGINIFIYLCATIIFYLNHNELNLLKFNNFDSNFVKPLFSMGISFFILDIASILLYNSGPIVISTFFNPVIAIDFQLPYKLLTIFVTLSHIILTPLWTLIITKMTNKNFNDIKRINIKLNLFLILISIIILAFTPFVNTVIYLWIGTFYDIDLKFIVCIAILVILSIICHAYQTLLKSMGKLRVQTFVFVVSIIISYSSMFILIELLHFGEYAFVLSLIGGLVMPVILLAIAVNKNIKKQSE